MKINDAYIEFLRIVNGNATSNNISVDKPRFVMLFNQTQINVAEYILNKRNEDIKRYITTLLVPDKKLKHISDSKIYSVYELPKDFLDHSSLYVTARSLECSSDSRLTAFEIKDENVEELFNDFNNKPSFEYRETFYHLSGNKTVQVFKDNFSISKVNLTYYRYPKKVDISGYINSNGVLTTSNIDPEFDDKMVFKILLVMSKNFSANNKDPQGLQIAINQIFSEV